MFNSFSSFLRMMPFSKHCTASPYLRHFPGRSKKSHHTYHCDGHEFQSNYSGWPTKIVKIEIPSDHRFNAYPSVREATEANFSSIECGVPTLLSFSAREVSDGTLFKAIGDYDLVTKRLLYHLEKWVFGIYFYKALRLSLFPLLFRFSIISGNNLPR